MKFSEVTAMTGSISLLITTFPITTWFCLHIIKEYERAILFRSGHQKKKSVAGPGVIFCLPCVESYIKVDLRTAAFIVPSQEALTKDSVAITVDAVVYYRVEDPLTAVMKVKNYSEATQLLAMTNLRSYIRTKNLSEIWFDRESVSRSLQARIDSAATVWGIKVEQVEINDITVPPELLKSMTEKSTVPKVDKKEVNKVDKKQEKSCEEDESSRYRPHRKGDVINDENVTVVNEGDPHQRFTTKMSETKSFGNRISKFYN